MDPNYENSLSETRIMFETAFFLYFFGFEGTHKMGKVHGSLARAGKVKRQTPKVGKKEKKKVCVGRKKKRLTYNKRFLTAAVAPGQKRRANPQNVGAQ